LIRLVIASGVTDIGGSAFGHCSALQELTIPANVSKLGYRDRHDSFYGVAKLEVVALVGWPLACAIVANVEPALAPGARVVGRELAGQAFGRFAIVGE
jgi:hypothetical protein